jgi:hypothetical protein
MSGTQTDRIQADHDMLYSALKDLFASLDFGVEPTARLRAKNKARRALAGVANVPPPTRVRKVRT